MQRRKKLSINGDNFNRDGEKWLNFIERGV